jgi:quercetin dioxygenase-like cupin family protein
MDQKYTRLFEAEGKSHFEDCTFIHEGQSPRRRILQTTPQEMAFGEWQAGHEYSWHVAEAKQWVVCLSGIVEVELRNGEKRQFKAGDVIKVEDTSGSGHTTRVLSEVPWHCIYLPIS